MRRMIASWLAFILTFLLTPLAEISAQDAPLEMSPNLRAQLRNIDFAVYTGRLDAYSQRQRRTTTGSAVRDQRQEKLAVNFKDGLPDLTYELSEPSLRLSLNVRDGRTFEIHRQPTGDALSARVEFQQPAKGPLHLVVVADGQQREVSGASLWHLLLADRQLCEVHLIPLLEILNPEWQLISTADEISLALSHWAVTDHNDSRQQWLLLVAGLASDEFAVRQQSDLQLRQAGMAVVPFLQRLNPSELDAEQWFRVRRILGSFQAVEAPDTPDRVVVWLTGDSQVWLSLLDSPELSQRELALAQLQVLLNRNLEFDPTAPLTTRNEQLESLRGKLRTARNY